MLVCDAPTIGFADYSPTGGVYVVQKVLKRRNVSSGLYRIPFQILPTLRKYKMYETNTKLWTKCVLILCLVFSSSVMANLETQSEMSLAELEQILDTSELMPYAFSFRRKYLPLFHVLEPGIIKAYIFSHHISWYFT